MARPRGKLVSLFLVDPADPVPVSGREMLCSNWRLPSLPLFLPSTNVKEIYAKRGVEKAYGAC